MNNPLLKESGLPCGAPQFDEIRNEHYLPAFREGIRVAKSEIDSIVSNPEAPSFGNTIEALEYSGKLLGRVSDIFYNILEADADDELQQIAEEVSPLMTEYSMYVSLNQELFRRVKTVYDSRDSLSLEADQRRLLEETYRSFARQGANLSDEDKKIYSGYVEELSILSLRFGAACSACQAISHRHHASSARHSSRLPLQSWRNFSMKSSSVVFTITKFKK